MVQQRVLDTGRGQFLFRVTSAARRFLLQEGTDIKYGARHLKRAIEKFVVYPLANLVATGQIWFGDRVVVDWEKGDSCMAFHREGQGAIIPAPPRRRQRAAALRNAAGAAGEEKVRVSAMEEEPALRR
jgi:hypothetical protein